MHPVDQARQIISYAAGVQSRKIQVASNILAAQQPSPTWLRQVEQLRAHLQDQGLAPETAIWTTPIRAPAAPAPVQAVRRPLAFGADSDSTATSAIAKLLGLAVLIAVAWWIYNMQTEDAEKSETKRKRKHAPYERVPGVLGAE